MANSYPIWVSNDFGYDPFGMIISGRNWSSSSSENYRFGFNGYEYIDDIYGNDNAIDFGARIYDTRLCRFLSIDPRSGEYTWQSVYVYFSNSPIRIVDVDGKGGPDGYDDETQVEPSTYTIQKNDNFWDLENKLELEHGTLQKWNPKLDANNLAIGSEIFISDPKEADLANSIVYSNIPFTNGNYEVRDSELPLFTPNYFASSSIYFEFENGTGPVNSVFTNEHYATQELQYYNNEVQRIRDYVYSKFDYSLASMQSFASQHGQALMWDWAGYGGNFRPKDERGGPSQFIGSFTADVFLSYDGTSLVFVVTDSKSVSSLFYHVTTAFNHERKYVGDKYSNTYQKYIWSEPIKTSFGAGTTW